MERVEKLIPKEAWRTTSELSHNPTERLFGKERLFWHSSAHLLGWAMDLKYGDCCFLVDGPATGHGFYYDALLLEDSKRFLIQRHQEPIRDLVEPARIQKDITDLMTEKYGPLLFPTPQDLKDLTKSMIRLANSKTPFEYVHVSKEQAQQVFISSPFKLAFIEKIPPNDAIKLYKCGDFVDLCRGPHLPSTRDIKGILLTKTSASQFRPSLPNSLSRIYGISFDSMQKVKDYKTQLIEAEKRNHRKIGKAQSLFAFHEYSPGSPFFLPHGVRIIQRLKEYLREEYKRFGFQEVVTPLIYNKKLWETSGHWQNYKDDMFVIESSSEQQQDGQNEPAEVNGLKPMNCPGHCLLFADTGKSYRNLPLRFAEFSPLHRYTHNLIRVTLYIIVETKHRVH